GEVKDGDLVPLAHHVEPAVPPARRHMLLERIKVTNTGDRRERKSHARPREQGGNSATGRAERIQPQRAQRTRRRRIQKNKVSDDTENNENRDFLSQFSPCPPCPLWLVSRCPPCSLWLICVLRGQASLPLEFASPLTASLSGPARARWLRRGP